MVLVGLQLRNMAIPFFSGDEDKDENKSHGMIEDRVILNKCVLLRVNILCGGILSIKI